MRRNFMKKLSLMAVIAAVAGAFGSGERKTNDKPVLPMSGPSGYKPMPTSRLNQRQRRKKARQNPCVAKWRK